MPERRYGHAMLATFDDAEWERLGQLAEETRWPKTEVLRWLVKSFDRKADHPSTVTVLRTADESGSVSARRTSGSKPISTPPASSATAAPTAATPCAHLKPRIVSGGLAMCDACGQTRGIDGSWR